MPAIQAMTAMMWKASSQRYIGLVAGYPSPEGGGWPPQAAGWGELSVRAKSIDSNTPDRLRSISLFQNEKRESPGNSTWHRDENLELHAHRSSADRHRPQ